MKNSKLIILGAIFTFEAISSEVTIPNSFTTDTPAIANEVNQNFLSLSIGINDNNTRINSNSSNISINSSNISSNSAAIISMATSLDSAYRYSDIYYTSSDFGTTYGSSLSEIVSATCPAGSILVGGGVECRTSNLNLSTTNWGVVSSTIPSGRSIIGVCSALADYSLSKFGPSITARAICLSPAIIPAQSKTSSNKTQFKANADSSSKQGQLSEESLQLIENMKTQFIERVSQTIQ